MTDEREPAAAEAPEAEAAPEAQAAEVPPEAPAAAPALCPRCTGGGWVASADVCPECMGQPYTSLDGITLVCEHCHGTGRRNVPCPECGGRGIGPEGSGREEA